MTTGADKIVSLLQALGIRVVVADTRKLRSITEAKVMADRLDARRRAKNVRQGGHRWLARLSLSALGQ